MAPADFIRISVAAGSAEYKRPGVLVVSCRTSTHHPQPVLDFRSQFAWRNLLALNIADHFL